MSKLVHNVGQRSVSDFQVPTLEFFFFFPDISEELNLCELKSKFYIQLAEKIYIYQ